MRFHTHQVSECYDQNTATQASLMGIGQYLPNGVVMTPLFHLDDYSFDSALPSSLCLGWRADDPKFRHEAGPSFGGSLSANPRLY